MGHHLDRTFATDTAQQVFEARRLRGELGPQALDSVNRRLYPLSHYASAREFIADPELGQQEELDGKPGVHRG